jgi:hypothetical protein
VSEVSTTQASPAELVSTALQVTRAEPDKLAMRNLLGKPHEARILVTGTRERVINKKTKTVLNLACTACGEMFITEGYSVLHIMAAVAEHKERAGF